MPAGVHLKDIPHASGVMWEDKLYIFLGIGLKDTNNCGGDEDQIEFARMAGPSNMRWLPSLLVELMDPGPPAVYRVIEAPKDES